LLPSVNLALHPGGRHLQRQPAFFTQQVNRETWVSLSQLTTPAAARAGAARPQCGPPHAIDRSHLTDSDPSVAALLVRSNRHADAGEAEPALTHAQAALQAAEGKGDAAGAAEAVLCIACIELRLLGHFVSALDLAQRATQRFRQSHDVGGECRALATVAIAASRLAYYERAVDCALLAVKLAEGPAPTHEQVMAYHALGIAMFSGKCFVEAANAYQQAIGLALLCEPPLNTFELHSDLASTEAFRYVAERAAGGARLSLDMLEIHVERCHALLADATARPIAPASHTNNLLILNLTSAHLLTWRGRLDEAAAALARLEQRERELKRPWLLAAVHWGQAELALARGEGGEAITALHRMVAVARERGHEALLAMGLHVLSYVHEQRGEAAEALAAERRLAQREQLVRAQSLKMRFDVIEREVDMRRQAQQLQRLESDTRLYQRLAMEDGLTGLANRRQFEAAAAVALLAANASAVPLCLAMIDIDTFKQINDTFSHNTGDDVLRAIAGLLKAHTREQDLPARLAGDEFVILLRDTDLVHAAPVCRRLQQAVLAHDWANVAPGLRVSVSIGLAAAEAGDTLLTLSQRADAQMYADKRR
jgi:diguanylate cyclase (GGDEF)-like protein